MKILITKITIVCLSAVIFMTGIGVTIVNFCCDDCFEQFMSGNSCQKHNKTLVEEHSCCNSKSECHKTKPDCGHEGQAEDDCCKARRISIDLDSFQSRRHIGYTFVWVAPILDRITGHSSLELPETESEPQIKAPPEALSPRDYLSLIKILRI